MSSSKQYQPLNEVPMDQITQNTPVPTLPANMSLLVGPTNTEATCPYCRCSMKTTVKYTSTTRTHTIAALYCLMSCCCCWCLPFCWKSTRNADHYCPNCRHFLGTYQK